MGRRPAAETSVSLFPFLSILACVIGILVLMIVALTMTQLDQGEVDKAIEHQQAQQERADDYDQIREQAEKDRAELERLKKLLAEAEKLKADLARALDELKRLQTEQKQRDATAEQNLAALAEANRLRDRLAELEPELQKLEDQIKKLQAQLAQRKKPPAEAEVVIQPSGSGTNLKPTFIECAANDVVLLQQGQPQRIRSGDLANSKPFHDYLDQIKAQPRGTVIFLLRPDGVVTYQRARSVALSREVPHGKLPVLGQGQIDLSLFSSTQK